METFSELLAEFQKTARRHADVTLAIATISECQHGVVSAEQLGALGLDSRKIARRVDAGTLFPAPIARAIYQGDPGRLSEEGRRAAGLLWAPPATWLTGTSAAAVLDLESPRGTTVHLLTHDDSARRRPAPDVALHRSDHLPRVDVTEVDGVPCTTFARTVLAVAGERHASKSAHAQRLDQLLERAEQLRLYDHSGLLRVLEEHPNAQGRPALRGAMGRVDENLGRSRSWFETLTTRLIAQSSILPTLVLNAHLEGVESDIWFPGTRAIIELDGLATHHTPAQLARDAEREAILRAAGYAILRLRWQQVVHFRQETLARIEAFYLANTDPPAPGAHAQLVIW